MGIHGSEKWLCVPGLFLRNKEMRLTNNLHKHYSQKITTEPICYFIYFSKRVVGENEDFIQKRRLQQSDLWWEAFTN